MERVLWHVDVKAFSEALALRSEGDYEVTCEHVHSCRVPFAKTMKYKVNGQWFTWIDYETCSLLEDLSTARITWLPHPGGLRMELRTVDLIQISLVIGRSNITNEVAEPPG